MLITNLKPYPKNAKKHDKKQIQQVADSIKRFGFVQPIVVDRNNEIVIGHCRFEAAKLLNLEEVPTISVENLSKQEVNALRLADNKLNESAWDINLAIEDLKELDDVLLDLTGFDKDLLVEPDAKDDVIPENVPARTKLGDLYELGPHRVLCGDSTQHEAVLRLMEGKKADMVFTDPPYGLGGYAGRSGKFEGVKGDDEDVSKFYKAAWDMGSVDSHEVYIWGGWYNLFDLPVRPKKVLVWKKNGVGMGRGYRGEYELCFYYGDFKGQDSDVWSFARDVKYRHPTQKPIQLAEKALLNSSVRDAIIQDIFLGSGSTLIAAQKTGRICYGMELDPKYVDVIVQRYVDYVDNPVVKLNGKIISWNKTEKISKKME